MDMENAQMDMENGDFGRFWTLWGLFGDSEINLFGNPFIFLLIQLQLQSVPIVLISFQTKSLILPIRQ